MPRVTNPVLANACRIFLMGVGIATMLSALQLASAQNGPKRFSVEDDIALTQLSRTASSVNYGSGNISPDHQYILVLADRGRLDINKAESSIRVYRVADLVSYLSHPEKTSEPVPLWSVTRSTHKYGPIFDDVRWLRDSSGVVFLAKTVTGNNQLLLADIDGGAIQSLTLDNDDVTGFDVRSNRNYVYSVLSPAILQKAGEDKQAPVINGTGRSLYDLLFPDEGTRNLVLNDLSELWAVVDGKRFRIVDNSSNHPVSIHRAGQVALALSPDGHSVLTALPVREIPAEWETLFPSRTPAFKVKGGRQNSEALNGFLDASEYVLIDLYTGKAKSMVQAPIGFALGWSGQGHASWSADGQSVVLSNTFLPRTRTGLPSQTNRPCVVVIDILKDALECVDGRNSGVGEEWKRIVDARFVGGNKEIVEVVYSHRRNDIRNSTFVRQADGSWKAETVPESARDDLAVDVSIKEGVSDPPLLIATDKRANISRVIWDPNPQLKDIKLGEASVFKWKDKTGRDWVGGLYKPLDYVSGKRYPLVIQTQAFTEHQFLPSGSYPTTFAAQELASAGIMVLQVESCPLRGTPDEGACQVAGYEGAVEQLTSNGLVDPDRLGIVGFSRGCFYALETLTTSALRFKAASIADGVTFGYSQYIENLDLIDNGFAHEAEVLIGPPPFGPGMNRWLARSPLFNMDRVTAPVEVLATTLGGSILGVWEPYATLRYLHKPVDLVLFNSEEHVFTNPVERLASQGNTVDWFRFWLKGEEDPDPAKADQYARWRELRKLQLENESKAQVKEKAN